MIAVSNTSPLVLLDKAGHLWILGKLFEKVFIPLAVDAEWLRPGGYVVPQWLTVATVSQDTVSIAKDLYQKIDKGEAEAIALFSSMKADLLLIDDLNGRRQAKAMGFPVVGTLGILIAAKRKGIIPEITAVLEILKQHRFYVSDEVLKRALILAGETKE
jgi:predicted nucleic acid-binding protein